MWRRCDWEGGCCVDGCIGFSLRYLTTGWERGRETKVRERMKYILFYNLYYFNVSYLKIKVNRHSLICYIFLSLFSLTVFTALLRESSQTLHWNPRRSSDLFADISKGILLNLCIYIMQRIRIFIEFHLYIFWIWSWRSMWVWRKPHELLIFSLRFCRFNELMVI